MVKSEKITIKDIATMAGVSTAAVSYVINDKPGVNGETRKKIQDIIKKTGFSPNINSKRLSSGKSYNIHAVLDRDNPRPCKLYYLGVTSHIIEELSRFDYNLIVSYVGRDDTADAALDIITKNNADGILFFQMVDDRLIGEIADRGIPCIVVDNREIYNELPHVSVDYTLAAYTATRYLIDAGHKKIAYVGMKKTPYFCEKTLAGYRNALSEAGICFREDYAIYDDFEKESVHPALNRLLSSADAPTAFFCVEDFYAVCVLHYIKKLGFSVPEDISIIALDDMIISEYTDPALSTIRLSETELAQNAVRMIMELTQGRDPENCVIKSDDLIIRESVKKIV
jgi:DNA-binding LacI/PurR family transcriptional regulator